MVGELLDRTYIKIRESSRWTISFETHFKLILVTIFIMKFILLIKCAKLLPVEVINYYIHYKNILPSMMFRELKRTKVICIIYL